MHLVVSIRLGHSCTAYECLHNSNALLAAGLCGRVLQEHRRVPSCFPTGRAATHCARGEGAVVSMPSYEYVCVFKMQRLIYHSLSFTFT